ncbi:hypothetical protein RBI13_18610 [Alcaligenaceae bacterium A4P071]|nr:hypothetical protein [Alcaligenaceae bacterium A4P071]
MTTAILNPPAAVDAQSADEPLFSSAHAALTFAFNYSAQAYDRPTMARMAEKAAGGSVHSGKRLAGIDGAGQAGIILGKVAKLWRFHQAIIVCRFAPQTCECRSCGGAVDSHDWLGAVREVSDVAVTAALSAHPTARVLRDAIVARHFGKKILLSDAAARADVSAATATNHNKLIVSWLRGSRTVKGTGAQRDAGVIGEEARAMHHITDLLLTSHLC